MSVSLRTYLLTKKKNKNRVIKNIFKFLRAVIITLVVLYGLVVVLLHIPAVQEQLTLVAHRQLSALLDTPVQIGHITVGYPDRIILDDVKIEDKQGNRLLQTARLSARFEWMPLFRDGRISIHTAQIFGLQAEVNRQHPDAPLNVQFIIDKLSSPDDTPSESSLDLRINSLQVRRSRVKYDVFSEPETDGVFNPNHIAVANINANISLKALHSDSINLHVKRLDFEEQSSGFALKGLETRVKGGRSGVQMQGFDLQLPQSRLKLAYLDLRFMNDSLPFSQVDVQGGLQEGTHLTLSDVSPFVPALSGFHDKLLLEIPSFNFSDGCAEVGSLKVCSPKKELTVELADMKLILPKEVDDEPYAQAVLKEIAANESSVAFLMKNLGKDVAGEDKGLYETLKPLQPLKMTGKVEGPLSGMEASVNLMTGLGNVEADALLSVDKKGRLASYKGDVMTPGVNLLPLLGEDAKLGNVAMVLHFDGNVRDDVPQVYVKGILPTLEYNGYQYQHITMDGVIRPYTYEGLLALDDPNISFKAYGHADIINQWPSANVEVEIRHFRPHELQLTEGREGMEYSAHLKADFSGDSPDNLVCDVQVDSLLTITPQDTFLMEKLAVNAYIAGEGYRVMQIEGDFIHAFIEGDIEFKTLADEMQYLAAYHLASLQGNQQQQVYRKKGVTKQRYNRFDIELKLLNSKFYPYVLDIPLVIKPSLSINGRVDAPQNSIQLTGNVHHLIYDGAEYESGVFRYDHSEEESVAKVTVSKHQKGNDRMTMMLNANAADDSLKVKVSWGNHTPDTYAGMLDADVTFDRQKSGNLTTLIHVKPSTVIVNNSDWDVAESTVRIDSGYVHFHNFGASSETQHLAINGSLTDRLTDSLTIDLNRMTVEYILDVVRFKSVDFAGLATGKVYVCGALNKDMQAHTTLHVENFHFNHGLMGDMDVTGRWDKEIGILIDADIREADIAQTTVTGFVSPQNDSLDLRIGAGGTNLAFLNSFIGGVLKDIKGRTRGDVHLYGPFSALNLIGDAVATASFTPQLLDTPLTLQDDTVRLRQRYIELPSATLRDKDGHTANVSGRLHHDHLSNMQYNFDISLNRFLFYNTYDYDGMPFYGQLYGTGEATLSGGGNLLSVGGQIRTAPGTIFYYDLSSPESLTDNKFVTFVDKTIRPEKVVIDNLDLFNRNTTEEEVVEESEPLQVIIDMNVDATTDADVRVKMDNLSDYSITAKGAGDIQINFDSEGETKLKGSYIVENGQYKLSILNNTFLKDFQLKEGSEIRFTGNGGEAELNVQAVYTVHSASLTDLIPDATFNQNSVKVDCIVKMTGKLDSPDLAYDIDLPTVNDEEKQLVRSAISTEEQMQRQFVYLLGVGKFYTFDYASTEREQSSDAVSSLLSTTLSGQLNNLLSQALNTSNWNFSSNFSTGQEGWTDLEVEGILSGRMLNNRLLVNGNIGYRENQMQSSNFIGDFDAQYQLLRRSRVLWLKGYKTTNDRYFAKQAFNTWGLGFIMRHEFNNKKDFFPWRKKKK